MKMIPLALFNFVILYILKRKITVPKNYIIACPCKLNSHFKPMISEEMLKHYALQHSSNKFLSDEIHVNHISSLMGLIFKSVKLT